MTPYCVRCGGPVKDELFFVGTHYVCSEQCARFVSDRLSTGIARVEFSGWHHHEAPTE